MTLLNYLLQLFGIIHITKPKPRYWATVSPLQAKKNAMLRTCKNALKTKPYWAS